MTIPHSAQPSRGTDSFFSRVFDNDALKKGLSAAAAGVLIAVITEAVWPGDQ